MTYSSYSHNITFVVKAKLITDKNSPFDRGSIGVMGLCAKKNKSQYMGVLGYPVARGIKRRICPSMRSFSSIDFRQKHRIIWIRAGLSNLEIKKAELLLTLPFLGTFAMTSAVHIFQ